MEIFLHNRNTEHVCCMYKFVFFPTSHSQQAFLLQVSFETGKRGYFFKFYYRIPINCQEMRKVIPNKVIASSVESIHLTVTHITFSVFFNNPVSNLLPLSVTHLFFQNNFNQSVDFLPACLSHLRLGGAFNQPVDHLPSSLLCLHLHCDWNTCSMRETRLESTKQPKHGFHESLSHLPSSLTELDVNFRTLSQPLQGIPPSLRRLTLTCVFFHGVRSFSPSLTHLSICAYVAFFTPLVDLPSTLTHLRIDCISFDQSMDDLPPSLTHLEIFSDKFYHPLTRLPQTLTYLRLHKKYPMHLLALDTLTLLASLVGISEINFAQLPPSLTTLIIGDDCIQPLGISAYFPSPLLTTLS